MYTKIKGAFYQSFVDDTVDNGPILEQQFKLIFDYKIQFTEQDLILHF
jgi:hypothetical protein